MFRKVMKRTGAVFFMAALLAGLTACGGSEAPAKESGEAKAESEEDAGSEKEEAKAQEVTIEEQALVEWEGLKVTATGLEKDEYSEELSLKLLVENDTSYGIKLSVAKLFVNGCCINYSERDLGDVPAGKKANEEVALGEYGSGILGKIGIGEVGEIEATFSVRDSSVDYYEDASLLYTSEPVQIQTSAYDRMDTETIAEGAELYNENGIRIVAKGLAPYYSNYALVLYAENTTDQDVVMEYYDVTVDGFVADPGSYSMIVPAGRSSAGILMLSYDETVPDEAALDKVEKLEFGIKAYDAANDNYWYDDSAMLFDTGILAYTQ